MMCRAASRGLHRRTVFWKSNSIWWIAESASSPDSTISWNTTTAPAASVSEYAASSWISRTATAARSASILAAATAALAWRTMSSNA